MSWHRTRLFSCLMQWGRWEIEYKLWALINRALILWLHVFYASLQDYHYCTWCGAHFHVFQVLLLHDWKLRLLLIQRRYEILFFLREVLVECPVEVHIERVGDGGCTFCSFATSRVVSRQWRNLKVHLGLAGSTWDFTVVLLDSTSAQTVIQDLNVHADYITKYMATVQTERWYDMWTIYSNFI